VLIVINVEDELAADDLVADEPTRATRDRVLFGNAKGLDQVSAGAFGRLVEAASARIVSDRHRATGLKHALDAVDDLAILVIGDDDGRQLDSAFLLVSSNR